jgi:hypothetical protein
MKKYIFLVLLFNFIYSTLAHGFLAGLVDCDTKEFKHFVRNYRAISFNIDSLRNPTQLNTCRNTQMETSFKITQNSNICVALAISNGAEHVGGCNLFLNDKMIDTKTSCLSHLTKGSCGNSNIPQLVTNDMCLFYYNYIPDIETESGILKWSWTATHLGVNNPEFYENCLDITNSNVIPSTTSNTITQTTSNTITQTTSNNIKPTPTQINNRNVMITVGRRRYKCFLE